MEPEAKRPKTGTMLSFNYSGHPSDQQADDAAVPEDVVTLRCLSPLERIPPQLCNPRTQLKEVSFPEGLKIIGKKAFEGCIALQNVALLPTSSSSSSSLEIIEEDAFKDCSALTEASLSEGIRVIGPGAFFHCSSLSKIKIPSTMTIIELNTFCGCSSLVDVDLAEGVKTIRTDAFAQCSSLQRMVVTSTVEVIEDGVFWQCKALQEVKLFEGLQKLGKEVFRECSALKEVSIPSTVETLEESTFEDCTALTKVELKTGLKVIGENALGGCTSLTRIEVPSTVETIHRGGFWRCFALADVTLQDGLKTIASFAFAGCKAMENIEIPSTVEKIQEDSFFQCESLRDIHINDGSLTELIDSFKRCNAIENVRLPSTMRVIGQGTFFGKVKLVEINLPMGLKAIKSGGLANCHSLERIKIPSTVEEIAYQAFSGCLTLVTVEFPRDMVATIGEDVFRDCLSLVNISIPSGMTEDKQDGTNDYVHANCFGGESCTKLVKHLGKDNLLAKATTHRYDGFPVHAACYYSSTTTVEELLEQINLSGWNKEMKTQLDRHKQTIVDPFGMTPFHILALGVEPRHDLMEVLLDAYPSYVLCWRDRCAKRVTDYLDWSRSPFEMVLQKLMVDRVSDWGRDDWKSKMIDIVNDIVAETDDGIGWDEGVAKAYCKLAEYELIASASLLELVSWKIALNAAAAPATSVPTDRSKCRALCGADVIIPNVIAFLKDNRPEKA
mmetsp:Transcript_42894/g.103765  ORF Transcript_42894/g.103765 Transcript_42894/m.103765 type:complete len:726 (-) Transcript_42894:1839-4016(-)